MPISQERMLSLIEAGEDAMAALARGETLVRREVENVAEGRMTAEDALGNIAGMLKSSLLLEHPVATAVTLSTERRHFAKFGRHNQQVRDRMRKKRGGLVGVESAPGDLLGGLKIGD